MTIIHYDGISITHEIKYDNTLIIGYSYVEREGENGLDKVEVRFTWDRKTDPAKMAYETAKTETETIKVYDEEKKAWVEKTEYGTLYGWQNDIVR